MKLSHALEGFWLSKRLDFSPATVRNYEGVFRQFLAHLGNREMETITSDDIRRYLDYLHKHCKLSKRSVHSQWAILSSLWTWAEDELQIPHVIRGHVPAPSYRKRAIIPFTHDEIKRLLDAAAYSKPWLARNGRKVRSRRHTADHDKAIILTLLDTGIQGSELCDLTVKDYQQESGRLHIRHGKGNKAHFVYAGIRSQKTIWRYLLERDRVRPSDALFASKTDNALHRNNLRHTLNQLGGNG